MASCSREVGTGLAKHEKPYTGYEQNLTNDMTKGGRGRESKNPKITMTSFVEPLNG